MATSIHLSTDQRRDRSRSVEFWAMSEQRIPKTAGQRPPWTDGWVGGCRIVEKGIPQSRNRLTAALLILWALYCYSYRHIMQVFDLSRYFMDLLSEGMARPTLTMVRYFRRDGGDHNGSRLSVGGRCGHRCHEGIEGPEAIATIALSDIKICRISLTQRHDSRERTTNTFERLFKRAECKNRLDNSGVLCC